MGCFWTDLKGVSQTCDGAAPAPGMLGTVEGVARLFVDIFSNGHGFSINGGSVLTQPLPPTALFLRRIDFYHDNDPCSQSWGAPPSWFPPDYTDQVLQPGSADPVISQSGMSLAMPYETFNSNGSASEGYIVSMADLSVALGQPSTLDYHFVAHVELDDGTTPGSYYGFVYGSFCG